MRLTQWKEQALVLMNNMARESMKQRINPETMTDGQLKKFIESYAPYHGTGRFSIEQIIDEIPTTRLVSALEYTDRTLNLHNACMRLAIWRGRAIRAMNDAARWCILDSYSKLTPKQIEQFNIAYSPCDPCRPYNIIVADIKDDQLAMALDMVDSFLVINGFNLPGIL